MFFYLIFRLWCDLHILLFLSVYRRQNLVHDMAGEKWWCYLSKKHLTDTVSRKKCAAVFA